jgi:DNA-nicking Smr family endonuclease
MATARRKQAATVSAEDAALFREAIGSVQEVRSDRAELRPEPPPPVPAQTLADERSAMRAVMDQPIGELELELWEPLSYVQPGVPKRILRQLGRGEFSVGAELDLHGMNQREAADAIRHFLDGARADRRLCVRVIHGKGMNAKGMQPVLKQVTDRLLRHRGDVLAYRSARSQDGGAGAVLVLLRGR